MKKLILSLMMVGALLALTGCSSFKAQRVDAAKSDEKAMEITDKWVQQDTTNAITFIMNKMQDHKGLRKYLAQKGKQPKIFIGEVRNGTSEAYFPIDDMNDKFLADVSESGDYILIDAQQREKLLKEITYQNDGMVDPEQAKRIGKQSGADLMVFGDVRMKPEERGGKTIKQYSVNIRMTNVETGDEVFRGRFETSKYSEQKSSGW